MLPIKGEGPTSDCPPRPTDLRDARSSEGHDDGHHVNSELKLEELGDAVVDVPAPHHRLDDAAEVVVCQDDVGRLLGHVSAGDALEERRGCTVSDELKLASAASKIAGQRERICRRLQEEVSDSD